MAAFQPQPVATQAITIGARPPIRLPRKFIQPETVPENLPPKSEALVQLTFMLNPRNHNANASQPIVSTLPSDMAVIYRPKQQQS